ncbi:DUF1259 domain-containing protein [Kitasatospora sp. NPDC096204]|uniref:DUF1259 domain-containing protein n=1 Tax=Kitasatospora sp. NPDC096204 TaxID=3364094 RepID=UPI003803BC76
MPVPTPVPTTEADWVDVVRALGGPGRLIRGTYHHTPFPRHDLHVVSRGVVVSTRLAAEVEQAHAALRRGGIDLVELHSHGLTDEPRLFFTPIWAEGDAVALARAVRPAVAATNAVPATA